jgi:plasmid stabilization system protein ParE
MELRWTSKALSDLARLYDFLAAVNQPAAARTVQQLTAAPTALLSNPRVGERLEEFTPRDVRRILVGHYEIRYEIADATIYLLRLWHTREDHQQ